MSGQLWEAQKMEWDHQSVYDALRRQAVRQQWKSKMAADGSNGSDRSPLTWLFEQETDCAVLYSPDSMDHKRHPLHLHPGRSSWRPDVYRAILPTIELVRLESKSERDRDNRFLCFEVIYWNLFAVALGLKL